MAGEGNQMPGSEIGEARAPRLVIAARLILVVLAGGAAASGFVFSLRDAGMAAASQRRYACPMHPEVIAAAPGECPICGMALSEMAANPGRPRWNEGAAARMQGTVDAARRRVFSQEVRGPAAVPRAGWVRALLYADEIETLEPGERGLFASAANPAARIRVRLSGGHPVRADDSTSWVEFEAERGEIQVPAGMAGWLELPARPRAVLVVPANAVLQSPEGPYVFASRNGRTFVRRPVTVGKTIFGLATVLSGLYEQERVATRIAFFLDAEDRLSPGAGSPAVKR
jgi:hypothetical protein